jgi:FKBP-type peptidyl-prolyl cis-trans isomerase
MRLAAWMRALLFGLICVIPIACSAKEDRTKDSKRTREPEPEVKIEDIVVGTGPAVEKGDWVELHYTATLPDGAQFETTVDKQEAANFRVGYEGPGRSGPTGYPLPRGIDKGLLGAKEGEGMKEGGRRRVTIPAALGYGIRGAGVVPPNSPLIYDIELLKVTK